MTALVVNFNTLPFLKLAVWSARRFIENDFRLWIWDNGSSDGSVEWIEHEADRIYHGSNRQHGHAGALNQMVDDAYTSSQCDPVLIMDSDIEILHRLNFRDVVEEVPGSVNGCAFADFHPLPEVDSEGRIMAPRINPAFAWFANPRAASCDFTPHEANGRFYDVGALHQERLGSNALKSQIMARSAIHYGNSTWPANGHLDPSVAERVAMNRRIVEERLQSIYRQ